MPAVNRLAAEKSPYLRQHAHNPVDWYPWGEEAFAKARAEDKPVFLSIGYSTCYWCHVMEKDCFEKEDVGAALNRDFVSVKVDREEHPEVDEIYMEAVMAMNGNGGWPMSVFLTPERKPFWGGTYIPREPFLDLLGKVAAAWRQDRPGIERGGEELARALREHRPAPASDGISQKELFRRFAGQAEQRFDQKNGGFGDAPKFPSSQTVRLLLRLHAEYRIPELLSMAERTLEAMACGGIYDQLGGGFHRYAVDSAWRIPHFEKMLYDNALLVPAYLEAYSLTRKELYAGVARETLDYLLRDLCAPGGAFFSAEDAGEVGREGEFYVWRESELRSLLGTGLSGFASCFSVSESGNFEHGTNVLFCPDADSWLRARQGALASQRAALLGTRARRPRPLRDSKLLTAWNGLALFALSTGFRVLGEPRYLEAALRCAAWIRSGLRDGARLFRRHCDGESRYLGTASDYACLIQGLIALYEASFDSGWLLWARELQAELDRSFWHPESGGYCSASSEEKGLLVRRVDRLDGPIPSPNSLSFGNLLRLSQYFSDPDLDDRSAELFLVHGELPEKIPAGLSALLLGLRLRQDGGPRLLVLGDRSGEESLRATLRERFLPDLLVGLAAPGSGVAGLEAAHGGAGMASLCEDGSCQPPRPLPALLGAL